MKNKIFGNIFACLGLIVIVLFYLSSTKAVGGNVDSKSPLLQPPYNGQISAFELSHERSSYATLLSLAERNKVDLTRELADVSAPDAGFYKGRFFSFFPPGIAYVGLPFYKLGQYFNLSLFFVYSTEIIFAVLSLIVLFKISKEIFKLPVWTACFVVISTGIGSTFLNFVITFYQHVPSVFFLLTAYYSVYRYRNSIKFGFLWASLFWSCFGASIFFDYPNLILMSPILIYFLVSGVKVSIFSSSYKVSVRNSFLLSMLVISVWIGMHVVYNYKNFDNWKRFSNSLPRYAPHFKDTFEEVTKEDTEKVASEKEAISYSLNETSFINGLWVILFQTNKGLWIFYPIYFFSFLGLWKLRKNLNPDLIIPLGIMLVNLFLYASFHDPWGGWGWGPRYLIPSIPCAAIYFGVWLSGRKYVLGRKLLALLLFSYASAVSLLGVVGKNHIIPKPESELDLYIRPLNFWTGYKFVQRGENGTFLYNTFLRDKMRPITYYYLLAGTSIVICVFTLWVVPLKKEYSIENSKLL